VKALYKIVDKRSLIGHELEDLQDHLVQSNMDYYHLLTTKKLDLPSIDLHLEIAFERSALFPL
jgi:hypothetical protein